MEYLAITAVLTGGILMGILGGGGSIVMVPTLVYLFSVSAIQATGYSLFIVGFGAFLGAISYWRSGLVDTKAAIQFTLFNTLGVVVARLFIVPTIPEVIQIDWITITKESFLMTLFAVIMFGAAYGMIKRRKKTESITSPKRAVPIIALLVGSLTGIIGAGGGFLIVPALNILAALPMRVAIGTSLTVISISSLVGFGADVLNQSGTDWAFLVVITALVGSGIFVGKKLAGKISVTVLRPTFGWFVIAAACFTIFKEFVV